MNRVILGIERFRAFSPSWLKEARIGLLINQASINSSFRHTKEVLAELAGGNLRALFAPQHGIRGELQANMVASEDTGDPQLGVPIFSLYSSQTRTPTEEMLEEVDVLLIDLQDVGTRVYTFATTMGLCLEAAAKYGKKVTVLDRPNPIGGKRVEGNLLKEEFRSFVGFSALPMRHGLTMGELALFFNGENGIGAELEVVPMERYNRNYLFSHTGLPWVNPSPNIPTPDTALVYPGQVLLEGTNLSEGRGTTKPFEFFGAPYIDPHPLNQGLERRGLPGVTFREVSFIPQFDKWKGQSCHGLQLHVTNPDSFKPYYTTLAIIQEIMEKWPKEFAWRPPPYEYEFDKVPFDIIAGDDGIRKELEEGRNLDEMEVAWGKELEDFLARRERCLLY
ncbi:MAG: DUF1343 domain-containing protein [Deltaproteobacteria bacterium]|nr:MAG: DUF1343 domain-containing protein [Deltaproteobacteria bacterium]